MTCKICDKNRKRSDRFGQPTTSLEMYTVQAKSLETPSHSACFLYFHGNLHCGFLQKASKLQINTWNCVVHKCRSVKKTSQITDSNLISIHPHCKKMNGDSLGAVTLGGPWNRPVSQIHTQKYSGSKSDHCTPFWWVLYNLVKI